MPDDAVRQNASECAAKSALLGDAESDSLVGETLSCSVLTLNCHGMTQNLILRSAVQALPEAMQLPRIPKAVVFDMDGLLFDTEAISREAMLAAALRLGFEMSDDVFFAMVGLPPDASRAFLRSHYGDDFDVEAYWTETNNDFEKLLIGRTYLKAGVMELLAHLDEVGLKRAIVTSSQHEHVQRNLTSHDLVGRFHLIVAHGDYPRGKPSPDPFLTAADKLGVPAGDCLALEDSLNGVRSASAAGMMTIMVPDLIQPTDDVRSLCLRVARDLHEVHELLRASNRLRNTPEST
jgi:HAD superfamily hydrolase (TIGR01509 family)